MVQVSSKKCFGMELKIQKEKEIWLEPLAEHEPRSYQFCKKKNAYFPKLHGV